MQEYSLNAPWVINQTTLVGVQRLYTFHLSPNAFISFTYFLKNQGPLYAHIAGDHPYPEEFRVYSSQTR